mgnify:FL=1
MQWLVNLLHVACIVYNNLLVIIVFFYRIAFSAIAVALAVALLRAV